MSSPSPTPSTRDIMRAHLIILFCCGVLAKKPVHVPGWPELPFPFSTALIANNGAIHISGMQGVRICWIVCFSASCVILCCFLCVAV